MYVHSQINYSQFNHSLTMLVLISLFFNLFQQNAVRAN